MTTEESNKKADEYVEMFFEYADDRLNQYDWSCEQRLNNATQCAIKLVDELINELDVFTPTQSCNCDVQINKRIWNLEKVKEVLINRLK